MDFDLSRAHVGPALGYDHRPDDRRWASRPPPVVARHRPPRWPPSAPTAGDWSRPAPRPGRALGCVQRPQGITFSTGASPSPGSAPTAGGSPRRTATGTSSRSSMRPTAAKSGPSRRPIRSVWGIPPRLRRLHEGHRLAFSTAAVARLVEPDDRPGGRVAGRHRLDPGDRPRGADDPGPAGPRVLPGVQPDERRLVAGLCTTGRSSSTTPTMAARCWPCIRSPGPASPAGLLGRAFSLDGHKPATYRQRPGDLGWHAGTTEGGRRGRAGRGGPRPIPRMTATNTF